MPSRPKDLYITRRISHDFGTSGISAVKRTHIGKDWSQCAFWLSRQSARGRLDCARMYSGFLLIRTPIENDDFRWRPFLISDSGTVTDRLETIGYSVCIVSGPVCARESRLRQDGKEGERLLSASRFIHEAVLVCAKSCSMNGHVLSASNRRQWTNGNALSINYTNCTIARIN